MEIKGIYIDGSWVDTGSFLEVLNKYDDSVLAKVCVAAPQDIDKALEAADRARHVLSSLTLKERGEILDKVSALIRRDADQISMIITQEAGKGISLSRAEVVRSIETFKFAADEARRLSGELIPFDAAATGANRFGYVKRYPIGVVAAITPFNFPLNLVAHKVAPAIAAGCPIVLKPASATPLTSIKLVELLLEAGLPPGGVNLLVGSGDTVGEHIVVSDKVSMITFTGSPEVGLSINQKAGLKKVVLEMGNNSAVIIHKDADISQASEKCAIGAFAYSGQVCISVQRVYIHESRYEEFRKVFLDAVKKCKMGDPKEENTLVGPMIHESKAIKIEQRVREAEKQGAIISTGGKRKGNMFEPTVLENCTQSMRVVGEEAFAPVVCLMKYKTLSEAINRVNASKYGLQAGIYTNDINSAFKAIDALEVGGVMINEVPTFRVDQMPYGGVKLSGLGREGAKYAIEEMTEMKTVMFNLS